MSFPVTVRLVVESASPADMPKNRPTGEKLPHTVIFRVEVPGPQSAGENNPPSVLGHLRYEFGTDQHFVNGQVFEATIDFAEIGEGKHNRKKA